MWYIEIEKFKNLDFWEIFSKLAISLYKKRSFAAKSDKDNKISNKELKYNFFSVYKIFSTPSFKLQYIFVSPKSIYLYIHMHNSDIFLHITE